MNSIIKLLSIGDNPMTDLHDKEKGKKIGMEDRIRSIVYENYPNLEEAEKGVQKLFDLIYPKALEYPKKEYPCNHGTTIWGDVCSDCGHRQVNPPPPRDKIICQFCEEPIKDEDFGGTFKLNGKMVYFHNFPQCLLALKIEIDLMEVI